LCFRTLYLRIGPVIAYEGDIDGSRLSFPQSPRRSGQAKVEPCMRVLIDPKSTAQIRTLPGTCLGHMEERDLDVRRLGRERVLLKGELRGERREFLSHPWQRKCHEEEQDNHERPPGTV